MPGILFGLAKVMEDVIMSNILHVLLKSPVYLFNANPFWLALVLVHLILSYVLAQQKSPKHL